MQRVAYIPAFEQIICAFCVACCSAGDAAVARELLTRSVRVSLPLAKAASLVKARELWRGVWCASLHDFTRERFERHGRWLRDHAWRCISASSGCRRCALRWTGEDGEAPIGVCKGLLVGRAASADFRWHCGWGARVSFR
ncbi:MAG: hypothetical protein U0V87_13735 [Acidobacteriota bacterium]